MINDGYNFQFLFSISINMRSIEMFSNLPTLGHLLHLSHGFEMNLVLKPWHLATKQHSADHLLCVDFLRSIFTPSIGVKCR